MIVYAFWANSRGDPNLFGLFRVVTEGSEANSSSRRIFSLSFFCILPTRHMRVCAMLVRFD